MDKIQLSRDHHVADHFRKKSLFFRDTRDNQKHDAKKRFSIPVPSSEKPLAEITGYIDVGDGCWRPNVLVTKFGRW